MAVDAAGNQILTDQERFATQAKGIGLDLGYLESPEQGFMRFAQQFDPVYGRRAVYSQQDPLTARWLLNQPTAQGTFSQFLQPGGRIQDPNWGSIRSRAEQIGALTGMSPTEYFDQLQGVQPAGYAGLTPGQELGYLGTYGFGAGDQAADRQRQLVNLMALQRGNYGQGGGGQYQGAMAGAIGNVMNELYQQFALNQPGGNFLNWYLERSQPGGRLDPTTLSRTAAPAVPAVPTGTATNPY
jgi:hypothetical protein